MAAIFFQLYGQGLPSKNELARSCKNLARILHARLAWHVHAICPSSCTILHDSCTILHDSCTTILARNGARFCKRCCKNNYLQVWSFLHFFWQDLARIGARLCKIVHEKGHIACTCQASLACKILARFLHDLASSFLLGRAYSLELGSPDPLPNKNKTVEDFDHVLGMIGHDWVWFVII